MNFAMRFIRTVLTLGLPFIFLFSNAGCTPTASSGSTGNIAPADTLRVGITANAPPLIYRRNGKVTGLEAELAEKLGAYLGKKVHYVEVDWKDQIPALDEGKTDIIMSGMSITELRQYRIDFSDPYLVSGQVSLVRRNEFNRFSNGLSDLLNITVRIGSVSATTGNHLVVQQLAGNEKKEFTTPQQAIASLLKKEIDVFVYDLPMNFYFGALHEAEGLVPVPTPLTREFLAWGIRKGDTQLLNTTNAFLKELKESGELQEMAQRWIPFYRNLYNQ